jgi:hypothetical protein
MEDYWAGSHFAPSRKMKFVAGAPRNQLSFQVTVVESSLLLHQKKALCTTAH